MQHDFQQTTTILQSENTTKPYRTLSKASFLQFNKLSGETIVTIDVCFVKIIKRSEPQYKYVGNLLVYSKGL